MNKVNIFIKSITKVGIDIYAGDMHLLSYNWDKSKPYIHPLKTPNGQSIALLSPHDHLWHLGLFFSWKYVNGINFWEDDEGSGNVTLKNYSLKNGKDFIQIHTVNHWAANGNIILCESRTVTIHIPAGSHYFIDFDMEFYAENDDVVLDRLPVDNPDLCGGYAGLSFRPTRSMYQDAQLKNSNDSKGKVTNGESAKWVHYLGKLDGGKDLIAGIAVFDHTENPRYPSPFFTMDSTQQFGFLAASFIFHEPYIIKKNERLKLKYRVLVHDQAMESDQINTLHSEYIEKKMKNKKNGVTK